MRRRIPSHDGLWMDNDGDTWVVDVCHGTATLIHDGCSYLANTTTEPVGDIIGYGPFNTVHVPELDDWPVAKAIRREQDRQAAQNRKHKEATA